ncbi:ferrochelatase [Phenylobacterium sp.]|uniref:ferrochelatase n=1 Tax=Phenylobacterium sp. TaxID=1871053 RepID=UPI003523A823
MTRLAVVLFNLGGPDGPGDVRPFLHNLFKDPAIIAVPAIARYPLAALISSRRAKSARANYALMGGGSPLLKNTRAQGQALEAALTEAYEDEVEVRAFIAMRYWTPFAEETARAVEAFAPDDIVLTPLYPQYSTTTTASSLTEWSRVYRGRARVRTICCYPDASGLAAAHAQAIEKTWHEAGKPEGLRLLFSAHGLPEKVVDGGDPYQIQIEATAQAVAALLPADWDWRVCYQSRVGPLKWIGPSTDEEIRRAGAEGKGVIIAPIAFVSEHVETLVELDHEYAALAQAAGCAPYLRAPTPGVSPAFIDWLRDAVMDAQGRSEAVGPAGAWRCSLCPKCPASAEAQ